MNIHSGAIGLSIIFGYPLTFGGFRSAALEFAKVRARVRTLTRKHECARIQILSRARTRMPA